MIWTLFNEPALTIKKATPKHCSKIAEIAKDGKIFNYGRLFYSLLCPLGWIYVVQDSANKVIGFICYLIIPFIKKKCNIIRTIIQFSIEITATIFENFHHADIGSQNTPTESFNATFLGSFN